MGLNIAALRLLLHARHEGAKFDRVITIGRLDVLVSPQQLEREFAAFGDHLLPGEAHRLIRARDRFCEPIIERMGAQRVDSLDASDFEGASVIHDLNQPLAERHKGKYSLLLDGGTLEHVFNFPEAIKTCMSLVEVGGHVLLALPSNNEMGHGFYQFSPELFYRSLSPENGFVTKGVYLAPIYKDGQWWKAKDPLVTQQRVGYNHSADQMGVLVFAEKVSNSPLFVRFPHQSDYVSAWEGTACDRVAFIERYTAAEGAWKRKVRSLIPEKVLAARRVLLAGNAAMAPPHPDQFSPFNPLASEP